MMIPVIPLFGSVEGVTISLILNSIGAVADDDVVWIAPRRYSLASSNSNKSSTLEISLWTSFNVSVKVNISSWTSTNLTNLRD